MRLFLRNALTCGVLVFAATAFAEGPHARTGSPEAAQAHDKPAGTNGRRELVERLAQKLEARYVLPDVGQRYATKLREHAANGRYDALNDREAFATRITEDLNAIAPDGHLHVRPSADYRRPAPGASGVRPIASGSASASNSKQPTAHPPAVEDAKWLADGVAYIRFNEFPNDPKITAQVDQFLREHAGARALIIDARTCRGGGIQQMNVLLPYLYARETGLVSMDLSSALVATLGPPPDTGPALREVAAPPGIFRREHVALPHPTEHRLFNARVFYLTSRGTASAAEHLALALKRTKRATLVGDRTAGANHFGGFEDLGDGYSVFLPVGRTIDPDTGEDWEGKGIQPDVVAPPDEALDVALQRAQSDR